jgi:hypothetical protein
MVAPAELVMARLEPSWSWCRYQALLSGLICSKAFPAGDPAANPVTMAQPVAFVEVMLIDTAIALAGTPPSPMAGIVMALGPVTMATSEFWIRWGDSGSVQPPGPVVEREL